VETDMAETPKELIWTTEDAIDASHLGFGLWVFKGNDIQGYVVKTRGPYRTSTQDGAMDYVEALADQGCELAQKAMRVLVYDTLTKGKK
jgi:hypothetical protein